MSLFDFFVSFGNKLGGKNTKTNTSIKNNFENLSTSLKNDTNNSFVPITISIDRELNIDSALSVLEKTSTKLSKVTNYRTIKPEHGKVFLRKGVQIHHTKAFRLKYSGLLTQSDVHTIYAVTGTGKNDDWKNIRHIPMYKVGKGFEALVSYEDGSGEEQNQESNINIAFKDPYNNWDNNEGNNYCFNMDLLKGPSDSNK